MGRPLLTALREFIIVVLCVILLIMRANSLFFMMKFIRICDVILRYLTLEGVLLFLLVCFLSLLLHLAAEVEPHLHLVRASGRINAVRVIKSVTTSLRGLPSMFVGSTSPCIAVRCLHVECRYHLLEGVRVEGANSRLPVDCLISSMGRELCLAHLNFLCTILYLASAARAFAMGKRLGLRLRYGCFHIDLFSFCLLVLSE